MIALVLLCLSFASAGGEATLEAADGHGDAIDAHVSAQGLLDTVVSSAPIVLFATDAHGVITMSRGKGLRALGLQEGERIGQSILDMYQADPTRADAVRRCLAGEEVSARLDLDGIVHETLFTPLLREGRVVGIVGVATDITERVAAEATLQYQASYNLATGLPNRTHFVRQLDAELTDASGRVEPRALFVIVLGGFSEVSETFGYEVGTQLLASAGERLQSALRVGERVGVIEPGKFAVAAPFHRQPGRAIAERLVASLADPFIISGEPIGLPVHVGLAAFPGHGREAELLIRAAEHAARAAASAHEPFAIYQREAADRRRNFTLLAELRAALDAQALRVEYQPLIEMESRSLHSLEALIRWDHPREGAISPAEFLPVAERGGLLPRITSFVLESAARQLFAWEEEGLRIAVNIPPSELLAPDIREMLQSSFSTWGVGVDRLVLEVTEQASMGEITPAQTMTLDALTGDGVEIAIDDFGTGYSNIANLQRLPWSELKVDQRFVRDIGTPRGRELVRALIDLGHSLGRTVVAEGIETAEQWAALSGLDCDVAQGFYLARPQRPEALTPLITTWGAA